MLLASLLLWLHSPLTTLAATHPIPRTTSENTSPVESWTTGPVLPVPHRLTMGETMTTTATTRVIEETTPPQVVVTPSPAEINISTNTYSEFIDVFCFLGLFLPVIYLCQARLRKVLLYTLSIVIPFLCATYMCLRQWRMMKSF